MARDDKPIEPNAAAEAAGLAHVADDRPGISRKRRGRAFAYYRADGSRVTDAATLDRIRSLAIPPAYEDVWICPRANGHIQATGRDAKGRKQYRYHPRFRETRDGHKYEHMLEFAKALPAIRLTVDEHMRKRGLPREKVLATVVHLLETTMIRVGNRDYARTNQSFGLSTLRNRHLDVEGAQLKFNFKGKSGKTWRLAIRDRRIARIVKSIHELPGQHLFQYVDEAGEVREIDSGDVNDYLREISGADITAKDFRTWSGTVLTALCLAAEETAGTDAPVKHRLRDAINEVAGRLGNTPTVCRKAYIHPEIIDAFTEGALVLKIEEETAADGVLRPEERAVYDLLRKRLRHTGA